MDPGPTSTLDHLEAGLQELGLALSEVRALLLRWAEIVREGLASGEDEPAQIARLRRAAEEELSAVAGVGTRASYSLVTPIEQSWQGLARYWRKRRI